MQRLARCTNCDSGYMWYKTLSKRNWSKFVCRKCGLHNKFLFLEKYEEGDE